MRTTDNRDMYEVERDLRAQVETLRARNRALRAAVSEVCQHGETERFEQLLKTGGCYV